MLRELSYIDPLTALWNRRRFREVLSDELRRVQEEKGKGFGLAFIDVDCFKGINDTFGHAAGDMVLREFAKLARGMLPDSATFARLGGDEFVLLLPDADEVPCSASLKRSGWPVRQSRSSMPIGRCVSASAPEGIGLRLREPSIRPRRTKRRFPICSGMRIPRFTCPSRRGATG